MLESSFADVSVRALYQVESIRHAVDAESALGVAFAHLSGTSDTVPTAAVAALRKTLRDSGATVASDFAELLRRSVRNDVVMMQTRAVRSRCGAPVRGSARSDPMLFAYAASLRRVQRLHTPGSTAARPHYESATAALWGHGGGGGQIPLSQALAQVCASGELWPSCSACGDAGACTAQRQFTGLPPVFPIGILWDSTSAPSLEDVTMALWLIDHELRVDEIFACAPSLAAPPPMYELSAMICHHERHFAAFFKSSTSRDTWLMFANSRSSVCGDWSQVFERCRRERLQPCVLLYERRDVARATHAVYQAARVADRAGARPRVTVVVDKPPSPDRYLHLPSRPADAVSPRVSSERHTPPPLRLPYGRDFDNPYGNLPAPIPFYMPPTWWRDEATGQHYGLCCECNSELMFSPHMHSLVPVACAQCQSITIFPAIQPSDEPPSGSTLARPLPMAPLGGGSCVVCGVPLTSPADDPLATDGACAVCDWRREVRNLLEDDVFQFDSRDVNPARHLPVRETGRPTTDNPYAPLAAVLRPVAAGSRRTNNHAYFNMPKRDNPQRDQYRNLPDAFIAPSSPEKPDEVDAFVDELAAFLDRFC
jgi:hypothetical protein